MDEETGTQWSGVVQGRKASAALWFRVSTAPTTAVSPLPTIGHSSIWVRSAAGFAPGPRESICELLLRGVREQFHIDHGEEHRYREYYAFPGLDLNAIGGRNFVKSIAEWNLPPWRFSRVGTPGFYASWLRPSVFVGGLATNLDAASARTTATDFGGQIDVRVMMLSELEMTVSVGGAVAFARDQTPRHEAMVSLKILR